MNTGKSDHHRSKAEECERLAEETTVPAFKQRYLELANNWRVLAARADNQDERDQADDTRGTFNLQKKSLPHLIKERHGNEKPHLTGRADPTTGDKWPKSS
jgi:hypothetical protein